MCGRYTLTNPAKFFEQCPWITTWPQGLTPRYNIAPGQRIMMVAAATPNAATEGHWGLSSRFSNSAKAVRWLINARRETVLQKSMFQHWFGTHRCLIPADGFYEWPAEKAMGRGQASRGPFHFRRRDGLAFAFAGFCVPASVSHTLGESQCMILTTTAVGLVAKVHPRMPVILDPPSMRAYLEGTPEQAVRDFLTMDMDSGLQMYRVGAQVNHSGWDGPDCVVPAEEALCEDLGSQKSLF
ncbi:MAG: SOS response-associated peptidase [Phycisphaerae bacterium]|nr:SOS response-associated peptidase [Phycisphaerae bacterium]